MQYYPNLTKTSASLMLLAFMLDPLIQNSIIYLLIAYLKLAEDEGGCCVSKPISRAYLTFASIYLFAWLVLTGVTTATIYKCL